MTEPPSAGSPYSLKVMASRPGEKSAESAAFTNLEPRFADR